MDAEFASSNLLMSSMLGSKPYSKELPIKREDYNDKLQRIKEEAHPSLYATGEGTGPLELYVTDYLSSDSME